MANPLRVVAVAIGHDLPAAIAYVWRTHGRADLVPETGPVIFVDVHELVGVVVIAVDGDRMTHVASARDFDSRPRAGIPSEHYEKLHTVRPISLLFRQPRICGNGRDSQRPRS